MIIHQGPIVVAAFPRDQEGFLLYAKNLGAKLNGNVALANPTPSLVVYNADLDALDKAQTKAAGGDSVAVADRNTKALKVRQNILQIVGFVQVVANNQPTIADAITVILSAGFQVRKSSTRKKPELDAKYGGVSGEVILLALAIAKAGAYFWEFSVDQKTWSSASETKISQTKIAGLTPGQVYYFRFRALTGKGKGDYSQVVSLMMH